MWIFPPSFCVLLLLGGVSGDEKVEVMERDSVTLKHGSTDIKKGETIVWMFNNDFIGRMTKETAGVFTLKGVLDEKFRDKLELDQTGFLTITNIKTTDTGLYQLNVKTSTEIMKNYNVTVRDGVKSVSVTEGDTVTLHTGVTQKQSGDVIQWKFKDVVFRTDGLNVPADESWSNIHLNKETGELTISNIQSDQTGDYKLEINTSSMIVHRTLNITVSGKKKTISVKEGELIMLPTGLIDIRAYNLILWKFGDSSDVVAEFNKETNRFLTHDSSDERFKGRLQMHHQSGSLSISDSETTDSGVYHLDMSSSTHSIQRNISVTVKTPDKPTPDPGLSSDKPAPVSGLSSAAVAWIVVGLLLVVFAAVIVAGVIYHRHMISELERRRDVEKNGTNDPLNAETANSDALQPL